MIRRNGTRRGEKWFICHATATVLSHENTAARTTTKKKESALLHRRVTFLPSDLSYFLPPFWFLLLSSPLSALVVNGVDQSFWFPWLLKVDLSARFVLNSVLNRRFS